MTEEEFRDLEDCANGKPYMLIIQHDDKATMRVKPGFNVGHAFEAIISIMKTWPTYKNVYADNIIELAKTLVL